MLYSFSNKLVRLVALALVGTFVLLVTACQEAGTGSGSTVTTAQAVAASQTVVGGVSMVLSNQKQWTGEGSEGGKKPGDGGVAYSTAGADMTGTEVPAGSDTTYDLGVSFSDYSDEATGYTVSGSGHVLMTMDSSTGEIATGTVTGNLTMSGGSVTTEIWNVGVTSTGGVSSTTTFTGTVTCNGTKFDASKLALDSTSEATEAATAFLHGVAAIIQSQSSWTGAGAQGGADSGNGKVAYGVAGASMTGMASPAGSSETTYAMTIDLSNFDDSSQTGYTLSGTISVTLTENNTTYNLVSGTITGTATFSGGPVASLTWNSVTLTGAGGSTVLFSGTVACDGTAFDVKTL